MLYNSNIKWCDLDFKSNFFDNGNLKNGHWMVFPDNINVRNA